MRADVGSAVIRSRDLVTAAQDSIRQARHEVSPDNLLRACVAIARAVGFLEGLSLTESRLSPSLQSDIDAMDIALQTMALVLSQVMAEGQS